MLTEDTKATKIVEGIFITMQVHNGFGRHVYYLDQAQIVETTKWTTMAAIQNTIGVFFVKASVCFFVLRILARTHKRITRTLLLFVGFLALLMLSNVLVLCLQCIPFECIWNPAIKAQRIDPGIVTRLFKAFAGMFTTNHEIYRTNIP